MYAVIKTGGKQLRVEEGQTILVEKLAAEVDSTVTFDEVVLVGGETTKVGAPLVAGATVTAKVVAQGKGKKITVFKYKPKKNNHRKLGHRQPCAGVSAVVFGLINAVDELDEDVEFDISSNEDVTGHLTYRSLKSTDKEQLLLNAMLVALKTIEENYSDYITIEVREVK